MDNYFPIDLCESLTIHHIVPKTIGEVIHMRLDSIEPSPFWFYI